MKRFVAVPLVAMVLLTANGSAQPRKIATVSKVQQFTLPSFGLYPTLARFSSGKYPDLLFFRPDSSAFFTAINNGNGSFESVRKIYSCGPFTSYTAGNLNGDAVDDFVIVHRDEQKIEIVLSSKNDTSFRSLSLPVKFYTEQALIGDITNDNIPDIICYGKLSSGITVFRGKGGGKFFPGKVLFENIPVSDVSLLALNGDKIVDLAVHNWLINETVVYLGLGKLTFAEQSVLSFAQDTVVTLFGDFNDDQLADVAVASRQNNTLQILEGDGLGNFSFVQTLSLQRAPIGMKIASFQSNNAKDILLTFIDGDSFSILANRKDGTFMDEIVFGSAGVNSGTLIGDVNGDGASDVVQFGTGGDYTIFWNSETNSANVRPVQTYAVGVQPVHLQVGDLDRNGTDDIIVSNGGSSSISLLFSTSEGFAGQQYVETSEHPNFGSVYSQSDTSLTVYTTHQDAKKISLITLRYGANDGYSMTDNVEQFSIPLPDRPLSVLPDVSFMEKGISLYAFMASETNSIVFYRQVKGTRFVAKSLVPLIPSRMVFATINDLNGDGKTDLLYIYADAKNKRNILGATLNDTTGEFKGSVFSFVLRDSSISRASLFVEDFDGDQVKDCLLYSTPENSLKISLGNRASLFGEFETIASDVQIYSNEQIQSYDFDSDGVMDVVFLDKVREEMVWLKGKGNGRFFPRRTVGLFKKETSFRCGDFNGDDATDIAYTNPNGYSVSIQYGEKK